MRRYTYLLIDLLSLSVPLLVSFHPKSRLIERWYALLPAIIITGLAYCIWDSWFTSLGLWGFNGHFITGIHMGNLPLEEIMFFVCIPYACLFTFDTLKLNLSPSYTRSFLFLNYGIATVLLIIAVIYAGRYYTMSAFGIIGILIGAGNYFKLPWLKTFYAIYGLLMFPFLIVNGLLTGTGLSAPIVWYHPDGIIGPRILTIPVEDVFYGAGLIFINLWLYHKFLHKKVINAI